MMETGDLNELPEPQEVVIPFEKEMHEWFGTPEWYYNKKKRSEGGTQIPNNNQNAKSIDYHELYEKP